MKRKLIFFVLGLFCGFLFCYFYFFQRNKTSSNSYFILDRDYEIEDVGILKKGIKIKFDEGMDEGFDRYILYLNIKNGGLKEVEKSIAIIPYWLHEMNTLDSPARVLDKE